MDKKEVIKDFEQMRNIAELKVLSKLSLEQPLTNGQFKRMMMLKNSVFPISDNEFIKGLQEDVK